MCDELPKIWILEDDDNDQNSDGGDTEDDNDKDDDVDDDFDDEDDKLLFCLDGNPLNELSTIQCSIELHHTIKLHYTIGLSTMSYKVLHTMLY